MFAYLLNWLTWGQKLKEVGASNDQKVKLQKTCTSMLKAIVEKMQEKCPLNYVVMRNASCLDPITIVHQPKITKYNSALWLKTCILVNV